MERPFGRQDSVLELQIYENLANQRRTSPFFFVFFFYPRSNSSILLENLRTFIRNPSAFSSFLPRFPPRRSTPTGERSPPLRHSFFRLPPRLRAHHAHSAFSTFAFTPSPTLDNSLMHNHLRVKASPPFFLHPVLHAPHRSHPRDDHGRNEPKEGEERARGEAFTRNALFFIRLSANQREHAWGETFTHNTLIFNTLQAKGEEVKAKSRKTADARVTRTRWAVAARRPVPPRGQRAKKRPSARRPPEKKL